MVVGRSPTYEGVEKRVGRVLPDTDVPIVLRRFVHRMVVGRSPTYEGDGSVYLDSVGRVLPDTHVINDDVLEKRKPGVIKALKGVVAATA